MQRPGLKLTVDGNSNLYSRQISGQGSYPNKPLVLAIEHMSEFKSNARTGTGTLDPQIKSLMLYRLSYPGFRKSPTPSPRWYFIINYYYHRYRSEEHTSELQSHL